uniref:Solute carrier family 35 member G1 n=1 Tax=Acanthochromis polyacanthus TaxID=80966 RepID=A0A3Q1FD57_9TELE
MGDCNHCTHERALSVEDDVTVAFHKVDSHDNNSSGSRNRHDRDERSSRGGDEDERTAERILLRSHVSCDCDGDDVEEREEEEEARGGENSLEGSEEKTLCPPVFCVRRDPVSREGGACEGSEKPKKCSGLGLFYAFLATVFFSIITLLVKTIQGIHAIEISALRCFFQILFIAPLLIYHKSASVPFFHLHPGVHSSLSSPHYLNLFLSSSLLSFVIPQPSIPRSFSPSVPFSSDFLFITSSIRPSSHPSVQSSIHPSSSYLCSSRTGFLGPRDKRVFLVLRGFIGSNAMILLFYAVQQMPLADATVIMFSNPVFTSLLAWVFLKEKCTIWDCVFTVFTLTGVILIARPPFLFGERVRGIEGNYTNHIKGTIAAFAGAIAAACTFVVLRKMGKSVHYYLSVWYYAVIGLVESVITVSVLGEWKIPSCGRDRWMLILIALLGVVGQIFLTKALQIEKAAPVALMRTVDVVLAFIFQFIFFNRAPTLWSLGGALCIVASTSGIALRKWCSNSRKT